MANSKKLENNHNEVCFQSGFYKVTKIIEQDLFQVEGIYLIKLKKPYLQSVIKDSAFLENIRENIVRVIPYSRNNKAEIISDVLVWWNTCK